MQFMPLNVHINPRMMPEVRGSASSAVRAASCDTAYVSNRFNFRKLNVPKVVMVQPTFPVNNVSAYPAPAVPSLQSLPKFDLARFNLPTSTAARSTVQIPAASDVSRLYSAPPSFATRFPSTGNAMISPRGQTNANDNVVPALAHVQTTD